MLQQDHREVEAYFDEYETLTGGDQKEALAVKICLACKCIPGLRRRSFTPRREVRLIIPS
jgi:hypothetical protein